MGWAGGWTWEACRAVGRVGAAGMVVALLCPGLLGRAEPAGLLVFRCRLCECREELSAASPEHSRVLHVACRTKVWLVPWQLEADGAGAHHPKLCIHIHPQMWPGTRRQAADLHLQPRAGPAAPREGALPNKKGAQAVLPRCAPIHPKMSLEQSKGRAHMAALLRAGPR